MSPPVTTSLIDLRTATGIDLKQPCSQAQKKSFLLARLLMTWWNAPCCLGTYRDSLHESPVLGLCRWCIDDRRDDRKMFFPMSILRHRKKSELRSCERISRICALLGIYRRFWRSDMSAGWAQLIIHGWRAQQMSNETNNGELLSILPSPSALHSHFTKLSKLGSAYKLEAKILLLLGLFPPKKGFQNIIIYFSVTAKL